ncbi:MAG: hypothetical protein HC838_02435 [Spirulinaceae cyanobacterium RM2_2_10]|nr:hypothetical protein [Spirulinaceae cyanobacterium RM2_2_10]
MDVHFSGETAYSLRQGVVHPARLHGWRQVTPLESLAGSRSRDDQLVALPEPVEILTAGESEEPGLVIVSEPIQTTGVALALVQFQAALGNETWQARHFDPVAREFLGPEVVLRLPEPVANGEGILPATARRLDQMPLNALGWYVSGVPDGLGGFVVQSLAPRALLRWPPQQVITGQRAAWRYVKREAWQQTTPGTVSSVLVSERRLSAAALLSEWQVGDRLLVVHVYGGIGGEQRERAAQAGLFFGHFAYGVAEVIHEPLANELSLAIRYQQLYAHNVDGIIAGMQAWWRYMGDRQVGWLGTRPVADILIRFPPFTGSYTLGGETRSPLTGFGRQLEAMMARYRVGDGTGATFVGPANNCAQDSNQALYDTIQRVLAAVQGRIRLGCKPGSSVNRSRQQRLQALLRTGAIAATAASASGQRPRRLAGGE